MKKSQKAFLYCAGIVIVIVMLVMLCTSTHKKTANAVPIDIETTAEVEDILVSEETTTEAEDILVSEETTEAEDILVSEETTEAEDILVSEEKVVYYPNIARPESSAENPYCFTEDEIAEIARIVQLEDGNCKDWCCAYLTASVIINRYLDWGYECVTDVIYANGQYATAYMPCDYISDIVWKGVRDAVACPDRNPHFQALFIQGDIYVQTECGTYYCY